jgi:uncharacterized membrane protein
MNKNVAIPIALLLLSVYLTLMSSPFVLLLVGVVICVVAIFKYRALKVTESKLGDNLLFRSGLAVIIGAIISVIFMIGALLRLW